MAAVPNVEQAIRGWFDRIHQADLKLPDGYFGGRAGENLHELSFVAQRPRKLLLELDERLLLVFTGLPEVEERELDHGLELVLSDFLALTFDYQGYGDDQTPHAARYTDGGEVTFGFLGRPPDR